MVSYVTKVIDMHPVYIMYTSTAFVWKTNEVKFGIFVCLQLNQRDLLQPKLIISYFESLEVFMR